jgi:mono/diheme cytochrome c family protein
LKNLAVGRCGLRFLACVALVGVMLASPRDIKAQGQKSNSKTEVLSVGKAEGENSAEDSQTAIGSLNGNVESGKKLFMKDGCFECHGTVGQGSTSTGGARIGPPVISFEAMVQYVHHPSGQMPPYTSKVISDQDLADVYSYLKAQPAATPAKNIPLLNQ